MEESEVPTEDFEFCWLQLLNYFKFYFMEEASWEAKGFLTRDSMYHFAINRDSSYLFYSQYKKKHLCKLNIY